MTKNYVALHEQEQARARSSTAARQKLRNEEAAMIEGQEQRSSQEISSQFDKDLQAIQD